MLNYYGRIPIRFRLTLMLVCIFAGTMLFADWIGLMPNGRQRLTRGRFSLCESLAMGGTAMVSRGDAKGFERTVGALVDRNDSLEAVRLLDADGDTTFETLGHASYWSDDPKENASNITVPIFQFGKPWGTLQVAFADGDSELGLARYGVWGLLAFTIPICFLQFSFFLKRMVSELNPEGAIPENVRSLLNTFAEGLVLIDDKEQILFANERLCTALAKSSDELVGKSIRSLDFEIADGKVEWPWDEASRLERPVSERILRLKRKTAGGQKISTFTVNCKPLPGQGLLATLDDITEIEENKAKLAVALGVAKDASDAKNAFLANMSREIRTPLNAVLGFTDVLRRGWVSDSSEAIGHLNMIHRSGAHLLEVINDILDLSKIEAGRVHCESIPTKVDDVIVNAMNGQRGPAQAKQIDLKVEFKTDIPSTLHCDPTRLRQIITNLLSNAIKFTEQGSVTVRTECRKAVTAAFGTADTTAVTPPYHIRIHVDDTGVGMTPEQQSKVFDSFAEADSATSRMFGGTGVGLSISRRLAESMGGTLTVGSVLGSGSTFIVTLPISHQDSSQWTARDVVTARVNRLGNASATDGNQNLPAKAVLIVEDGEDNRCLIELVLARAGAVVTCAADGQEAIEAIAAQTFDLVFMDIQMPVLDGMNATRQLRASGCKTPIVALTGNAMKGDREKCISAGCDDFLTKPVNLDKLLECSQRYLGKGSQTENVNQAEAAHAPVNADPAITEEIFSQIADAKDQGGVQKSIESRSRGDDAPIHTSLPIDDHELRVVVANFVDRLDARLEGMEHAVREADFETVRSEAHWLKGSGGTVGFGQLTDPALKLEVAAKDEDSELALGILDEIQSIRSRIVSPVAKSERLANQSKEPPVQPSQGRNQGTVQKDQSPIECALPMDDEDYREIVADFIERLDVRLMGMLSMVQNKAFEQLENEAHWLKGAGGTVGFPALTKPAVDLMNSSRRAEVERCQESLRDILEVRQRLVVPKTTNPSVTGQT